MTGSRRVLRSVSAPGSAADTEADAATLPTNTERIQRGLGFTPGQADPALVELLAKHPDMIVRLGLNHGDDGHGQCRSCSSGAQAGRHRHPCQILLAVEEAAGQIAAHTLRRREGKPDHERP